MTKYARRDPDTGAEDVRDLPAPPPAGKGWVSLTEGDPPPTPTSDQVVVRNPITFGANAARLTWGLRAKTQAELDFEANAGDRATLLNYIAGLRLAVDRATLNPLTPAEYQTLAARDPTLLTQLERLRLVEFETKMTARVALHYTRQLRAQG